MGLSGQMPNVYDRIMMKTHLLDRVVGAKEDIKVDNIRTGDALMLTTGTSRTVGVVVSVKSGKLEANLKIPICINENSRIAISRQVQGRWRLIGWGELESQSPA